MQEREGKTACVYGFRHGGCNSKDFYNQLFNNNRKIKPDYNTTPNEKSL